MKPHDPALRHYPIAQGLYGEESRTLETMSLERVGVTTKSPEQDCEDVSFGGKPLTKG